MTRRRSARVHGDPFTTGLALDFLIGGLAAALLMYILTVGVTQNDLEELNEQGRRLREDRAQAWMLASPLACLPMPQLEGPSRVAIDVSGSMGQLLGFADPNLSPGTAFTRYVSLLPTEDRLPAMFYTGSQVYTVVPQASPRQDPSVVNEFPLQPKPKDLPPVTLTNASFGKMMSHAASQQAGGPPAKDLLVITDAEYGRDHFQSVIESAESLKAAGVRFHCLAILDDPGAPNDIRDEMLGVLAAACSHTGGTLLVVTESIESAQPASPQLPPVVRPSAADAVPAQPATVPPAP
jgi:hypothetical protein